MNHPLPIRVLVIHGASIQLRGKIDDPIFDPVTIEACNAAIAGFARTLGLEVETFHSSDAAAVAAKLASCPSTGIQGAVIDSAAFTVGFPLVSQAIADAGLPLIEVHISTPTAHSAGSEVARVATGAIAGFGIQEYFIALLGLRDQMKTRVGLSAQRIPPPRAFLTSAKIQVIYSIDPGHSQLHFDMGHIGETSVLTSRFVGFGGELHWDRETQTMSLVAHIDSRTVSSAILPLDALLAGPHMFHVESYPKIVLTIPLTSVAPGGTTVEGRLAIRGVERQCLMTISSVREGNNSRGFLVVGTRVAVTTLRSAFGMNLEKSRALSDEIRMIFNIEAKNEPPRIA